MTDVPNATDLIQRGQAAARVGLRQEAREYLREAVKLAPDSVDAWLDLAGVEDDPAAKRRCFDTVLSLEPENVDARLGLEMLQQDSVPDSPADLDHEHELDVVMAEASRQLEEAVGPPPADEVPLDDEVLYCANHPGVETVLRCNRCGKPICARCAVQTPVGYRCKQCVGQQQAVYYSGGVADYAIGGILALLLGGIASYIVTILGAWFIALILGPTIGIGLAELVRLAVRRRRSRYLWLAVAAGIVIGSLPALLVGLGSLWSLIAYGLFLVLAMGAATARLR
jgi:hypothetical protein